MLGMGRYKLNTMHLDYSLMMKSKDISYLRPISTIIRNLRRRSTSIVLSRLTLNLNMRMISLNQIWKDLLGYIYTLGLLSYVIQWITGRLGRSVELIFQKMNRT